MEKRERIDRVNKWSGIFLMFVVTCAGCDNRSMPEPASENVPIRLVTEFPSAAQPTMRSDISVFNGETVAFAIGDASGTYSEIWEARVTGKEAVLLEPHYYPKDGSYLYLRGYYPPVKPGINGVAYRLDGSQDLLLSNEQSGSLTDMFWQESKKFRFTHLLTRLGFRVRVTDDYPANACLLRLQIGGSHRNVLLDLNTGRLLPVGETGTLIVWEADGTGPLLSNNFPDTLTTSVMLEAGVPLTLAATVSLTDGTNLVYEDIPIHFEEPDSLSRAGTSYTVSVTLDMVKEKLSLSTSVDDWTEQEGGEVGL